MAAALALLTLPKVVQSQVIYSSAGAVVVLPGANSLVSSRTELIAINWRLEHGVIEVVN